MLLPLYPQHAMASTTTILVLAEELRQKHFPEMNFTNVPAFYNKPDFIEVLANSIKKTLGNVLTTTIYCFHTTEFLSVIFAKQTSRNLIVKLMALAATHRHRLTNFATVTNVMKPLNK